MASIFLFQCERDRRRLDGQIKTERFARRWRYSYRINDYLIWETATRKRNRDLKNWVGSRDLDSECGRLGTKMAEIRHNLSPNLSLESERGDQDLATRTRTFRSSISCWFWRKRDRLRRHFVLGGREESGCQFNWQKNCLKNRLKNHFRFPILGKYQKWVV